MINLDTVLKSLDDAIILVDSKFVFRGYWGLDESFLWLPPSEFLNKSIKDIFPNELGEFIIGRIQQVFESKKSTTIVYSSRDKKDWFKAKVNYIEDEEPLVALVISDHTAIMQSEQQKVIFENIILQNWDAIVFADLEGVIQYINPAANRLYGYKGKELMGQNVDVFNSHQSHDTGEIIQSIIDTGIWTGELIQIRKNRTTFNAYLSVQLIKNDEGEAIGYSSHSKDISNEKKSAKKLKQIIEERETLLKEIHHRVKNNLQVITSLLSLQSNTIDDAVVKNLFQQSQYRINAMATIHETLYQSDDFSTIGYDRYIKALCNNLILSMKGEENNISLEIDALHVKLNIDTAIPLGLLINEIMTNALKYGIVGDAKGKIYIKLQQLKHPNCLLEIGDDGVGFSDQITAKNTTSLGLKLIQNLTRQLEGKLKRDWSRQGTHYVINFKEME